MPTPSLVIGPTFPCSLYRPVEYNYSVALGAARGITSIRLATASDVSTYPSLTEGVSVLVEHASFTGFSVGQHMQISGAGDWNGIRQVVEVLDATHTVLDGAGYDTVTTGLMRIWYNNRKLVVYLWHDTSETEPRATLTVDVNENGMAIFSVNSVLLSWIKSELMHDVINTDLDADGFISTEFLSSVIFRMSVFDAYDVPDANGVNVWTIQGIFDPENGRPQSVVNGVHPYDHMNDYEQNSSLQWFFDNLITHELGNDDVALFLTYAPRDGDQVFSTYDKGRLVVLLPNRTGFDGSLSFRIVLYGYDANDIPTQIGQSAPFTPPANVSSFAIPCGPMELAAFVNPDPTIFAYKYYSVELALGSVGGAVTEFIKFELNSACKEVRRRFYWLNKLGGIDGYTFTRREVMNVKAKRSTISKPYASGNAFDWRQRMQRVDPVRNYTVSSEQVKPAVRRWIAEDMFESANILAYSTQYITSERLSPVIITSDSMDAYSTEKRKAQMQLTYILGTDNLSQEA